MDRSRKSTFARLFAAAAKRIGSVNVQQEGGKAMFSGNFRRFLSVAVAGSIVLLASNTQAAPLAVGNSLFPAPGEPDPSDGSTVLASLTSPFNVPGFFIGSLTATVVAGDPANPLGGLTFTYELSNAPQSPNAIARLTVTNYSGFGTDASYETPATGLTPALIDRLSSDVVGYSFSGIGAGPIFPGVTSAVLVLQTDATAWTQTSASIIDAGAVTVPTLGPTIPEPASIGLLGVAGCALLSRRRSR